MIDRCSQYPILFTVGVIHLPPRGDSFVILEVGGILFEGWK
jgi:hypothetical protein